MINKTIHLKDFFKMLENDVTLTAFCPSNYDEFSKNVYRKCVIVLPGGGYSWLSDREAEPVALRFLGQDIATFVLKYTVAPKIKYPEVLLEVYAAIAYLRKHYEEYHIDINAISLMGFSAGGHLAASASAFWQDNNMAKAINVSNDDIKVNGCLLGYPVISTTRGHLETIENITKNEPKLKELLSIDKQVTKDFPKTFIWHTVFDSVVDLDNSLLLAKALHDHKIFMEVHFYPMLEHGQSLAESYVYLKDYLSKEDFEKMKYNRQWVDQAIHFIKEYI